MLTRIKQWWCLYRYDIAMLAEGAAAVLGLLGALLLATKGSHAAWGWLAFLASNVGWITFGWIRRHWWLVAQQVGFTATSLLGIGTWWT